MAGRPCESGCNCGRHAGNFRGHSHSPATRQQISENVSATLASLPDDAWNQMTSASKPCLPGCLCARHIPHPCEDGCTCYRHTSQPCPPDCTCNRHADATRQAISAARQGSVASDATKAKLRDHFKTSNSFFGGATGDFYSALLTPCGYLREHWIHWGGQYDRYRVDFANPDAMTIIELDGPGHYYDRTVQDDINRDHVLQTLGWRVIRICHV